MRRPGPVIAISVVQLFGSACCFGMAALMLLTALVASAAPVAHRPVAPVAMSAALMLLLAGWGIVTALGLLWLRVWALVSTLLFAFAMACAALGMMGTLLNPMPAAAPQAAGFVQGIAVVSGLVLLGLAVWWIVYLVQRRTHAAFFAARPGGAPPRLPISLNVIAWALIGAGGSCLLALPALAGRAAFFLGPYTVSGWSAALCYLVFGAIGLVIGVGLLELRRWARMTAMIWLIAGMMVSIIVFATPGAYAAMLQSAGRNPALAAASPSAAYLGGLIGISIAAGLAQLYFLWTRRAAFAPVPPPPPATYTITGGEAS